MSYKAGVYLKTEANRAYAHALIDRVPLDQESPLLLSIGEAGRTLEQNALMWPLLQCLARQTTWHGIALTAEEWKDLLSAGIVKQCKTVPNIDGTGFVMVGQRTSKFSKRMFSDLIELIFHTGAELGVNFEPGMRQMHKEGTAEKLIEQVPSLDGQFRRVA